MATSKCEQPKHQLNFDHIIIILIYAYMHLKLVLHASQPGPPLQGMYRVPK